MLDPTHPIAGFFSTSPEVVLASLPALEGSSGAVTSYDTLWRSSKTGELRGHRKGIFCETIFAGDQFGHIVTLPLVHPAAYAPLVEVLQRDTPDIRAIARGEKALRDGKLVSLGPVDFEDDDLTGPDGLAEAVRRAAPDHRLLPLCTLTRIPVPPRSARPFRSCRTPEEVDPWIGPLNEAWIDLFAACYRRTRLGELDAPPVIIRNEAAMTQRAFEAVLDATKRDDARLVPALASAPPDATSNVIAIAFVGAERLIVQHEDKVRVLDLAGGELYAGPPAGCTLRGVVDGRYAVFEGFRMQLHPYLVEGESIWPPLDLSQVVGELTVFDAHANAFLTNAPDVVPRSFVYNDQPEDLFIGTRKLRVGGDRPGAFAYTHDLMFAWVGEDQSSEVIRLATGLPVAYPGFPESAAELLDLETGEMRENDFDDMGDRGASAVAFVNGRWVMFWDTGMLTDHRAMTPLQLFPLPTAAAFDPAGTRLALVVGEEIVIVDPTSRSISGRIPLRSS